MPKFLDALPLPRRRPLRISTDVPPLTGYSSVSPSPVDRSITPSVTTSGPNTLQCLFHVLCMYDFQSSDPVHLPFHKDEVLTIIKQERSGWWAAMRPQGDRIGWIPSSFVLPLNKGKVLDYSDETLRLYESLNESPLSADHDPWVPVSNGDYKVRWTYVSYPRLLKHFDRFQRSSLQPRQIWFYIKASLTSECEIMMMNHSSICQLADDPPTWEMFVFL